jgi:xanthine dehydrogenase accessory factor
MPIPHGFVEKLADLSATGVPFVCVTLVQAIGSAPQDAGSKMLVTVDGLVTGTVGGGKLEQEAIEHARQMLAAPADRAAANELVEWNLTRDLGMTCGGAVKLFFETYNHADWRIVIFGAGHVAAAVIHCLSQMECHVTCIDPRPEWLDRIGGSSRLRKIVCGDPPAQVAGLADDSFIVCMTMGQATDRPILEEVFRRERTFPYVGVIGSRAKRAALVRDLVAAGVPADRAEAFHCPIGLELGSNQPGEIAVSVVAQLIQERDRWRSTADA